MDLRCWLCGVEPDEIVTITLPGQVRPLAQEPVRWPLGDHEHSLVPSSNADVLKAGDTAFRQVRPI